MARHRDRQTMFHCCRLKEGPPERIMCLKMNFNYSDVSPILQGYVVKRQDLVGCEILHMELMQPHLSLNHLRQEQPSLAMLSTGTTVHSMRTRSTCFRDSVRLFWYSPAAMSILSQVITSSVVRPMQCLKLGPDASQPWKQDW